MGWPIVKLKECCSVVGGATPKRHVVEYWGEDIPWVTPKDISKLEQNTLIDVPEYISRAGYESSATFLLPKGTILLTSRAPIGNVAIAGRDMCTNQGFKSLIPGKDVDSLYLYHCMKSMKAELEARGNGATFKEVSKKIVEEFEIPLPPLSEQRRIALILEKGESLRRKRRKAMRLSDQLLRAIFMEMFGDPVTNPFQLEELKVDSFCQIVRGSSPRPKGDPRYYGGSVPRLMVQDLTRDGWFVTPKIDTLTIEGAKKSRPIEAGTVVMAASGNVGLTSILAVDACIHDGFIAFKNLDQTKVLPEFLLFLMTFLKSTHASREAGAIFKNITTSQVKEMRIPVPKISSQKTFVSILNKQVEAGVSLHRALVRVDELNASLVAQAFSGEL